MYQKNEAFIWASNVLISIMHRHIWKEVGRRGTEKHSCNGAAL